MTYDVVVIGGGITGGGILRDAAQRGLRALLVEMDSPAAKTTGISSGLIHGGLRYLPYDYQTAFICCREAGIIKSIAPDLLERRVFVWPVYRGQVLGLSLIEALLEGYDDLAPSRTGKSHVRLNAQETLNIEPRLNPDGLKGSVIFDEWSVEPRRLVEANLDAARRQGATVLTQSKVTGFEIKSSRVTGVHLVSDKSTQTIQARMVINATGPWAQETALKAGVHSVRLKLRKGVQLVVPRKGMDHAVLFTDSTGRHIGAYPRGEEIWVGPTDDPHQGSAGEIEITDSERSRLIGALKDALPKVSLEGAHFRVGVRPILHQRGFSRFLSRDYHVFDHEEIDGLAGLITVTGGKMTVYRQMAQEAVDLIARKLGVQAPCRTHVESLQGTRVLPIDGRKSKIEDWDTGHGTMFAYSLGRLVYFWLRHIFRIVVGKKRRGLELFKLTYSNGNAR